MTFRRAFVVALAIAGCCRLLTLGAFYYYTRGYGRVAMPPDDAYLAIAVLDTFDPVLWPERVIGGVPQRIAELAFAQLPGPLSVWGPNVVVAGFGALVWAALLAPIMCGADVML